MVEAIFTAAVSNRASWAIEFTDTHKFRIYRLHIC